jgi:uncharacterized protein (TIGR02118 family)
MEREEFRRYWRETHGPLLMKIKSLRKYIQNHVVPDPAQPDPPCDGVVEFWFDSAEAFQAALASPEGQAGMADLQNFCDPAKVHIFSVEEVPFV